MPEKDLFVTAITDTKSTDVEGVGVLRWVADKLYRWVQNDDASAITVGQVACHTLSDAATLLKNIDQAGGSAGDIECMAGVVMAASLATTYYGWIQVLGYYASVSVTNTTDTTVAAGGYVKAVDSAGHAAKDADTQPAYTRNIMLLAAMPSAQTPAAAAKGCLINCL